jgi:hypothetical protein
MPGAKTSVQLGDPRNLDWYLRASWHPESRTTVISQWRDDVCVASTPIEVGALPSLVSLFVDALQDAATNVGDEKRPTALSIRKDLMTLTSSWWRSRVVSFVSHLPMSRRDAAASDVQRRSSSAA